MHPVITIFCAFTRRWALEPWLADLGKVRHDPALTNLCFIIDSNDKYIDSVLKRYASDHGYRSFHSVVNEYEPNEIRVGIRRARIAEMKNQSKDLIAKTDGEYIIGFEDDTVFGNMESFDRLLNPLIENPKVGFVEGVQVGRHGVLMVGVWKTNLMLFDKPFTQIRTLFPPDHPTDSTAYERIDGGGFYGYATLRHLYLNHDYYTATSQPWGPDVNFGLWLRSQQYDCLVDWRTNFGHNDNGTIAYPNTFPLTSVCYNKNTINGKWDRTDEDHLR